MPKRSRRSSPSAGTRDAGNATTRPGGRRDPVTRLARFCEVLALGLVAASLFLNFANSLDRPKSPRVPLDHFPEILQKSAVIAVHTRTPWVTLAIGGLLVSILAFRTRFAEKPNRWVKYSPLFLLLVLALHAVAQAYLQSHGPLNIEIRGSAPAALDLALGTLPGVDGTSLHAISITRMTVLEGTRQQWLFLVASDLMYGIPILLAWVLTLAPKSLRQQTPTLLR